MAALQASQCTWPLEGQSLMSRQVSPISEPPLYSHLCKANSTLGYLRRLQLTVQPVPCLLAAVCFWGHSFKGTMQARAELLNSPVQLNRAATMPCVFTTCKIVRFGCVLVHCQQTICSGTCSITSWHSSANSTCKYQILFYLKTSCKM